MAANAACIPLTSLVSIIVQYHTTVKAGKHDCRSGKVSQRNRAREQLIARTLLHCESRERLRQWMDWIDTLMVLLSVSFFSISSMEDDCIGIRIKDDARLT
jgi:hypothetical protein